MRHCRCVPQAVVGCRSVRLTYESARGASTVLKKKEPSSLLGRRIRDLRLKRCWTQREAAERSFVTESAFRSYELGDRAPKREIVDRIAKAFGVRSEYLTAPEFLNSTEFCYALLQSEEAFHLKPGMDEAGLGHLSVEPIGDAKRVSGLLNEWGRMRQKLDSKEITQAEYDEWKQTWDDGEDALEVLEQARQRDGAGTRE